MFSHLPAYERLGGVEPEVIVEAEAQLGITFPKSYRAFLEEYGGVKGFGFEIFGLPPQPAPGRMPEWESVFQSTEFARAWAEPELRCRLVAIASDGYGNYFCLECGLSEVSEDGIIHSVGTDGVREYARSFEDFVMQFTRVD